MEFFILLTLFVTLLSFSTQVISVTKIHVLCTQPTAVLTKTYNAIVTVINDLKLLRIITWPVTVPGPCLRNCQSQRGPGGGHIGIAHELEWVKYVCACVRVGVALELDRPARTGMGLEWAHELEWVYGPGL